MGRFDWKHLKMRDCRFDVVETMIRFFYEISKTLEIIDFDEVVFIPSAFLIGSVSFPKLKKLKTTHLQINFLCSTLKELELNGVYRNPANNPMVTNHIEILKLTYSDIGYFFCRSFYDESIPVSIKKLKIVHRDTIYHRSCMSMHNSQSFLRHQEKIEEISIETDDNCYETFMQVLRTILKDMVTVRKLSIKYRNATKDSSNFTIEESKTITELFLDVQDSRYSEKFLRKIQIITRK